VKREGINILEVGTGSGCISISVAKEVGNQGVKILATDISGNALQVARTNSRNILGKEQKQINFQKADIINPKTKTIFDVVISNPPYIPTKEYAKLDNSVKAFEPRTALDGGTDGLDIYREIINKTKSNINKKTVFIFEIHSTSSRALTSLLRESYPSKKIVTIKDQYKRNRFIQINE